MKNNPLNIDKLIDSALAKDRANVPELPSEPESSLISQLQSRNSSGTSAMKITKRNLLSSGIFKLTIGLFSVAAIGVASYFFFSAPGETAPALQNNESIFTPHDSLKKGRNDTIIQAQDQRLKNKVAIPVQPITASDSGATHRQVHSNDLLPPYKKELKKDEIEVPIEEK